MRRLPLLLTLVVGVALWAAPSSAQVTTWFKQYTADSAAPGEGNVALPNGYSLCPPHADYCSGSDVAYHHANYVTASAPYDTNVLNTHNCSEVVVCAKTAATDGGNPEAFIESVLNDAGAVPTKILADVDGDGVISDAICAPTDLVGDCVGLDGDDGSDQDGDGTPHQTSCMYGIVANRIRLDVADTDGIIGAGTDTYFEVSCR